MRNSNSAALILIAFLLCSYQTHAQESPPDHSILARAESVVSQLETSASTKLNEIERSAVATAIKQTTVQLATSGLQTKDGKEITALICLGGQIGLIFRGEANFCSTLDGSKTYTILGHGVGLAYGYSARIAGILIVHPIGTSLIGTYDTGGFSISSLRYSSLLGRFSFLGADYRLFYADGGERFAILFGYRAGPMVDISVGSLTIR